MIRWIGFFLLMVTLSLITNRVKSSWALENDGTTTTISARVSRQHMEHSSHDGNIETNDMTRSSGRIVFPDNEDDNPSVRLLPTPPFCNNSGSFCSDVPNYPYAHVRAVIDRQPELRSNLETDVPTDEIAQRVAESEEETLCESKKLLYYPKVGQDDEKNWLFIINDERVKQAIQIEECVNPDGKCKIIEGFPEGYRTFCRQRYIHRRLYALRSNGDRAELKSFPVPTSCCCHVKFVGDPMLRMSPKRAQ